MVHTLSKEEYTELRFDLPAYLSHNVDVGLGEVKRASITFILRISCKLPARKRSGNGKCLRNTHVFSVERSGTLLHALAVGS